MYWLQSQRAFAVSLWLVCPSGLPVWRLLATLQIVIMLSLSAKVKLQYLPNTDCKKPSLINFGRRYGLNVLQLATEDDALTDACYILSHLVKAS